MCTQVGVASIASGVQRAGGSTAHPGTALDEALEQKAAYIEGGASPETSSLGQHAIFASMPRHAAFVCAISDGLHGQDVECSPRSLQIMKAAFSL